MPSNMAFRCDYAMRYIDVSVKYSFAVTTSDASELGIALKSCKPASKPEATPERPFDVYTTPGTHEVNGRQWKTACEPYSITERCRTEIWATQTTYTGGKYVSKSGWVFNNLTYKPSPRAAWKGNPLATPGKHVVNGRQWQTECDTPTTGRNGCRSSILSNAVVAKKTPAGWGFQMEERWVLNNIVRFS